MVKKTSKKNKTAFKINKIIGFSLRFPLSSCDSDFCDPTCLIEGKLIADDRQLSAIASLGMSQFCDNPTI